MNKKYLFLLMFVLIFGIFQTIQPKQISNHPQKDLAGIPTKVNNILRNSCFDCHSSESKLKWYDKITPANFLVYEHVNQGRAALNFANFNELIPAQQKATLFYALNKVLADEMPLPSYSAVHPETIVQQSQIETLKSYLKSISKRKVRADTSLVKSSKSKFVGLRQQPSNTLNGIAYINDWKNWTVISTTDRFDNGSMRIIYTNAIGLKAIQSKQTNPYPDGTILAKAAWEQASDKDGNIHTGKFIQVEFMIKNTQKYASTKGWGWARWKGMDLKPYGKTALFTNECTACHRPVKDNDYVFTMPLALEPLSSNKLK